MTILIAGGGIAGLTMGLTLHQIGVPFRIFESAAEIRPLGVGINLQPNAVRELYDLGLKDGLERIGVRTRQIGFHTKHGLLIWEEPRGQWAGYAWPQYSVHRGALQMMLYRDLVARAGAECIETGARVAGFAQGEAGVEVTLADGRQITGDLLIAADGIRSAIRAQMVPDEGEPIWNGQVLWRATTPADAYFGGGAMVMIGHDSLRVVAYPISDPDPETNIATINWIAEKRFDTTGGWRRQEWNRTVAAADILPDFNDWRFDWIDVPALITGAAEIFEYPMIDRDPLERWTEGRVTLMGDAAHPMYPVGSNGASQAIVDARVIGAKLLAHGPVPQAFEAYEAEVRPVTTAITGANRKGGGPDGVLQRVEDLCGGMYEDINEVIPHADLAAHSAKYKSIAGFSIEALNARPALIPAGARMG
ncbi:flavin-dependent oxidoreductase [Seohaeicola nanhaiensis]|uniref:Flavin-dependent oxidoreductase n=1 Tax=Seohaeicola nanhaiensis TaxID=1387282 RepID=A0ABV9KMY8_9RHOB